MASKWEKLLEDAIIGKLVTTLTDEGFSVDMAYHDSYLWVYAFESERRPKQYSYWVKLCIGNGSDVIVDYTINLEKYISGINEFAKNWI